MANGSIIDKALGLLPRVRRPRRSATTQARLAILKKNVARLSRDIEKLSDMVAARSKRVRTKVAERASRVRARPSAGK